MKAFGAITQIYHWVASEFHSNTQRGPCESRWPVRSCRTQMRSLGNLTREGKATPARTNTHSLGYVPSVCLRLLRCLLRCV